MLPVLIFLSEVVISHFYSTNVDSLTWRQEICTQLARAWDKIGCGFSYVVMETRYSKSSIDVECASPER